MCWHWKAFNDIKVFFFYVRLSPKDRKKKLCWHVEWQLRFIWNASNLEIYKKKKNYKIKNIKIHIYAGLFMCINSEGTSVDFKAHMKKGKIKKINFHLVLKSTIILIIWTFKIVNCSSFERFLIIQYFLSMLMNRILRICTANIIRFDTIRWSCCRSDVLFRSKRQKKENQKQDNYYTTTLTKLRPFSQSIKTIFFNWSLLSLDE